MAYKVGTTIVIEDDRDVVNVGNVAADGRVYSGGGMFENNPTITGNYTVISRNALSTGPVTIPSGTTITVGSGSRWVII